VLLCGTSPTRWKHRADPVPTRIVIDMSLDHAGSSTRFPNAVLYVQAEELRQIDVFVNYPTSSTTAHPRGKPLIDHGSPSRAAGAGLRTQPVAATPADAPEIEGQGPRRKAKNRRRTFDVAPGLVIHLRSAPYYGSQLCKSTPRG